MLRPRCLPRWTKQKLNSYSFIHSFIDSFMYSFQCLNLMFQKNTFDLIPCFYILDLLQNYPIYCIICSTTYMFVCCRLLSWAGKRIDPVAVDYILQKLGFQHARLTIPKWTQRGCMDPLDKILSMLVDKLLTSLEEEKHDCAAVVG